MSCCRCLFYWLISPVFLSDRSLGYEGSVKYRTREDYLEGEATFVRSSRFEVLSSDGFSLAELAIKVGPILELQS